MSPVEHKVVAPDMVATLRSEPNARAIVDATGVSADVEALSALLDATVDKNASDSRASLPLEASS